jgi:adenine deaminase
MIENGKTVPFKFHFGAPSCVPATIFETAGAAIDSVGVKKLLQKEDIFYLSEMMNFPGVLNDDEEVMKKIQFAKEEGKPIDGHAPGLMGVLAKKYIDAGITTDHECFTREEALEKLSYGMKIIIREGSAAKNFEALIDLLNDHPESIMFCSDDKHPDSLVDGHINMLCARAVKKGIDIFKILRAACINPVHHYKMNVGLLRKGEAADFILASDLENFNVIQTYIDGVLVANEGKTLIKTRKAKLLNNFNCDLTSTSDYAVKSKGQHTIPVIVAEDGQLITDKAYFTPLIIENNISSDVERDILKMVVVNRYQPAPPAFAFVKNFGLKQGAIASSVAHDSHNIVAVGVDDESLAKAVNMVISHKGGVSCVTENTELILPLPVAGLMSNEDGYKVAEQYAMIDKAAKDAGSTLSSPFMTLSFMALLVIPHLKLSDRGLFDGDRFEFVDKLTS